MPTPTPNKITVSKATRTKPDEPIYRFDSYCYVVADTTAPTVGSFQLTPNMSQKTILVEAEVGDVVSDVREVFVRFSTDGGGHWALAELTAPQSQVYDTSRDYSATVGPFCSGQTVVLQLVAVDNLLNAITVQLGSVSF